MGQSMHLIQCFLPLYDNEKNTLPQSMYEAECRTLRERFGGLTSYTRAPASGLWDNRGAGATHDDFVIYEVMAQVLDRAWWRNYRRGLEDRFRQDQIIIRAHPIELL
jgi:hypothetical protein